MVDRRPDTEDQSRAKRQKTEVADSDPKNNPYLAHMYDNNSYSANGAMDDSPLAGFKRHKTTAAMAKKVEDATVNPFNGNRLSDKYFSILKTRRDLPVHAQRYKNPLLFDIQQHANIYL